MGRWWIKPQFDIPRALPDQIKEQLSQKEKAVLGFCTIPPLNETERLDIKQSIEVS